MYTKKEIDILLVEDDPGDVELTRAGLEEGKLLINLHVVDDGVKALKYLRREVPYEREPQPDLVLLDLNLPKKDGREVLQEMKRERTLRSIPVVVLTTSGSDTDVSRCYDLGANCFVTKPIGLGEFIRVVNSIEEFWFSIVRMPSRRLNA